MFVDDLGILIPARQNSFQEVKECIALYEQAFGAKLNLRKSRVILIGLDNPLNGSLPKVAKLFLLERLPNTLALH